MLLVAACGGAVDARPSPRPPAPGARLVDISATTESSDLVVAFTVEGVPAGAPVTAVATADATARYACGTFLSEPISAQASGLLRARADGQGRATLKVTVRPPPPSGIACARDARPTSALFTNVAVADVTDHLQATVAGEFHASAQS